jgi:hypothetical protein
MKQICSVEIISLTPRFNAVNMKVKTKKRLNGFSLHAPFCTRLKPGVNKKLSTKQKQIQTASFF